MSGRSPRRATSQRTPAYASSVPSAPPSSVISRLSVSCSWMSRRRLPPSAARTAVSRRRVAARAEEIGDVQACDQQNADYGAHQHVERSPHIVNESVVERIGAGMLADEFIGELLVDQLLDGIQFGARL